MSVKQVIVIRNDLGMRKRAMVSHGAQASLIAVIGTAHQVVADPGVNGDFRLRADDTFREWIRCGYSKVSLRVASEGELLAIYGAAMAKGLRCSIVHSTDLTESRGTDIYSAVAIGPESEDVIDAITGSLELL